MRSLIEKIFNLIPEEHFNNNNSFIKKNIFVTILSLITTEILLLIFGKFLWNNTLVQLIDGVKPIESIWTILGLSVLFRLFFS